MMRGKLDSPLIFESLFVFLRLPYVVGSLLIAFLFGPTGAIIVGFIQTGSIDSAIERTFTIYLGESVEKGQGITILILLSALLFYSLYSTGYMHRKIVAAEQVLSPLLVSETSYDEVFGRVTSIRPPIILSVILLLPFLFRSLSTFVVFCETPLGLSYFVISYSLWFLIFCTFIWMYFSSIVSLHYLGKRFLKLKSYYEDRMLGVRPIGSLALNLAGTYYSGLSFLLVIMFVTINRIDLGFASVLLLFLVLGIVFFILPLITTHNRMVEAKRQELENIRLKLLNTRNEAEKASDRGSDSEVRDALNKLTTVLTADMTKNEIAAMPTWPFDVSIMTRLGLSVFAPILASVLAQYIFRKIWDMLGAS